jgi:hypothetical protein
MIATDRITLFNSSKYLFITTRIIVVDILTRRLPPKQVAGLIILNAHRATEQSGEGFAVRLLRQENRNAFVRGLSDEPGQAGKGLSSLKQILQALQVKDVFLWPRFQSTIQDDLCPVHVRCSPLRPTRLPKQCTQFQYFRRASLDHGRLEHCTMVAIGDANHSVCHDRAHHAGGGDAVRPLAFDGGHPAGPHTRP